MASCLIVSFLLFYIAGVVNSDLSQVISSHMGGGKGCPQAGGKGCPKDVTFWLYTKSNQKSVQLEQAALNKAPFSKGPLKVIIHGFWNNKDSPMNKMLKDAYFRNGEYNIVVVDWGAYCKSGCYGQAAGSVGTVGACVGQFLAALQKAGHGGAHVMGHSLGAHVGEIATGGAHVDRLTKFDPASPQFPRATKGSAGFTDVYHSNAGVAGQEATSGDVDVYLNNGAFQPGCKCVLSCSHMRSVEFFADSIKSKIPAFPCGGWAQYTGNHCHVPTQHDLVIVGDNIDRKKKGTFLVFTNERAPFGVKDSELTDKTSFYGFQRRVAVACKPGDIASIISDMAG